MIHPRCIESNPGKANAASPLRGQGCTARIAIVPPAAKSAWHLLTFFEQLLGRARHSFYVAFVRQSSDSILMEELKVGRAELAHREWVEFRVTLDSEKRIQGIDFKAWGCHDLIESARKASLQFNAKKADDLKWDGSSHWDLLISEAFEKIKGTFKIPVDDPETCHCRKIPTARIDEAIVLGAHTPERVTAWTTASSGCGTCRPVVEKIIAYRMKKSA